jgi:hypothetical protein
VQLGVPEDGDSDKMDERQGCKDGATSSTGNNNLKWAVTRPLAGGKPSQYQWHEHIMMNIPGSPKPPSNIPRQPIEYVNPLDE